jgi:hypothetical protein
MEQGRAPSADVRVLGQQAAQASKATPEQVASGNTPPPTFDAGEGLVRTLTQVQQVMPDVSEQEMLALFNQAGPEAYRLLDAPPEEVARLVQAMRGQQGGG